MRAASSVASSSASVFPHSGGGRRVGLWALWPGRCGALAVLALWHQAVPVLDWEAAVINPLVSGLARGPEPTVVPADRLGAGALARWASVRAPTLARVVVAALTEAAGDHACRLALVCAKCLLCSEGGRRGGGLAHEGMRITRANAEQRMLEKLTRNLTEDIAPLLPPGIVFADATALAAFERAFGSR